MKGGGRKTLQFSAIFLVWLSLPSFLVSAPLAIISDEGVICHLKRAFIHAGQPYYSISEFVQCRGGSVFLSEKTGFVEIQLVGRRMVFWPFGTTIAVVGDSQTIPLPPNPWQWREGWLYVSHDALELLLNRAIAVRLLWEHIPITYPLPLTYVTDLPRPKNHQGLRIVLDPGHGGEDQGTSSSSGIKEKDVSLSVALRAQRYLEEMGHTVLLTRNQDIYVPLKERARIANEFKADLFVSIHCNSGKRLKAQGWETYVLSSVASDPDAMELALLENQEEPQSSIEDLLKAINRTYRENISFALAQKFQELILSQLSVENRGIKRAPFFVLLATEMPSFLVEIGFLSNPDEAKNLGDPVYQGILSRVLAEALDRLTSYLRRVDNL